jgi:hypothetical protein
MNILEWLLKSSDPAVQRLTKKYILSEDVEYTELGWIQKFLSYYDGIKHMWGNGYYSPKWISTFYTLRDLASLEVNPENPIYQQGLRTLIRKIWNEKSSVSKDICVVAMFTSLLVYGGYHNGIIYELLDYILENGLPDGGWNCEAKRSGTKNSSVHTTLSVLEALRDFNASETTKSNQYRKNEILLATQEGQEYLLRKKLLRKESNNSLIFQDINKFHFPTRWKYDYLRALVYFTSIQYPYDVRMQEALSLLKIKIKKGYLTKGTTYAGRLHFKMEQHKIGSMNTFRGLYVLKFYEGEYYQTLIKKEIKV